jgi:NAD(P)H dehydrogenase (quinone)
VAKVAVIYYSAYGHTYRIAQEFEAGAKSTGAEVRLRKVHELAPEAAIASQKGWLDHRIATQHVHEVTLDDLDWADGFAFGTPTRFGLPAAQLKQFIDTTGPVWSQGKLADKAVTAFAGAMNPHGGQESTLLALYNTFYHWGSIIVPTGYTNPVVVKAGGNPYGVSFTANDDEIPEAVLEAARYQGARLATYAALTTERRANALGAAS